MKPTLQEVFNNYIRTVLQVLNIQSHFVNRAFHNTNTNIHPQVHTQTPQEE